jgi:hypothetical protein
MTTITEARAHIKEITFRINNCRPFNSSNADYRKGVSELLETFIDQCEGNIDFYCFNDNDNMIEKWEQVRDDFEDLYNSLQ